MLQIHLQMPDLRLWGVLEHRLVVGRVHTAVCRREVAENRDEIAAGLRAGNRQVALEVSRQHDVFFQRRRGVKDLMRAAREARLDTGRGDEQLRCEASTLPAPSTSDVPERCSFTSSAAGGHERALCHLSAVSWYSTTPDSGASLPPRR